MSSRAAGFTLSYHRFLTLNAGDEMEWMKKIIDDSGAKIKSSEVFTTMLSESYLENPQCLLELAMAIVLDKPVFVIALDDVKVPENLIKMGAHVERVKRGSDADMKRAVRSIGKVASDIGAII